MKRFLWILLVVGIMGCAGLQVKNNAQAAFDRGLALFNEKNYAEAVVQFRKAVELKPEFGEAYLYLGKSYVNQHQWLDAAKSLKSAYQLAPEETKKEAFDILTDAVIGGAEQLSDLGKLSTWLAFLANTMADHPELVQNVQTTAVKMVALARELVNAENYKPALEILQHLIRIAPEKLNEYLDLAITLAQKGYPLKAPDAGI